ncbi:protein FIP1 isoform X2 [Cajanus cajan]|uniref:protein FIP1 isoform X2 n=1 Tax=Cajanus cajan TaxID=3821 RepID=UPI00098DB244|nr:protein FIP1 isoform X2 [Cajanus cajan]
MRGRDTVTVLARWGSKNPGIQPPMAATDRYASPAAASAEDNALFLDILHEAPLFAHRKAARVLGSVFYCILLAGYATLAIGAPWIFRPVQGLISPVLCSCDVLLLLLTGIFQQYLVYQVQKIRLQGYYSFSQKLKFIVRIPFSITAYGTAAMLLVIVWKPYTGFLSISAILRIIMIVEAVSSGCFMSLYIGYIHQYNSLNSHPDVLKSLYSPLQPSSSLEGLRYHDGRLSDQQMALLQYQRENLHFLSEEILRLQECLSKYERTDDRSTPQVDLAHLLAARDQELRTLSAEMNQVQSELRLARSLIADRDSEIQHVRMTNNQYVEENERLRAILGEWSTRAAKLERALEVEKMSTLELQRKLSTLRSQTNTSAEATEHGA